MISLVIGLVISFYYSFSDKIIKFYHIIPRLFSTFLINAIGLYEQSMFESLPAPTRLMC